MFSRKHERLIVCSCLLCFRNVFSIPKSIQATVTLLENLHVILEKTPRDDIRAEVLPMLYNAFESTTIQVQVRVCLSVCPDTGKGCDVESLGEELATFRKVMVSSS